MTVQTPVKRRLDLSLRGSADPSDPWRGLAMRLIDEEQIEAEQLCSLPAADAPLGATRLDVQTFLAQWRNGMPALHDAALEFGRLLYRHLFEEKGKVAEGWAQALREARGRGLRLDLRFPEVEAAHWLGHPLAGLPFELLNDGAGFLFRRPGWSTVRRNSRLRSRTLHFQEQQHAQRPRVLVAWANVAQNGKTMPADWFEDHDRAVQALAQSGRADRLQALPKATRRMLADRLEAEKPHVLLWIGHGEPDGNALVMHDDRHPRYASDPGVPVGADDFAADVREGWVDLALLWSCHGAGTVQPLQVGVAEALLDENRGNVAAVLASFTAIEAPTAARLSNELIQAWASGPDADLETSLARARQQLDGHDLAWARPVLFLRTPPATAVSLLPRALPVPPPSATRHGLRWLPQLPPHTGHYIDHLQRLAALQDDLRHHAIVVVEGLPGLGKTELALAHAHALRAAGEAVAFVDVSGHPDPGLLVETLGLLVRDAPFETRQDLLAALHGLRWTLVIDNAEDLLRSEDSRETLLQLLAELRTTGDGFRAVVTSRRSLAPAARARAQGLHTHALHPLGTGEARALFLAIAGPRLPVTQAAPEVLDPLLDALGGIARAVVLIAGQLGDGVGVPELRRRLEEIGAEAIVEAGRYGAEVPEALDGDVHTVRLVSALNLSLKSAAARVPVCEPLLEALAAFPAGLDQALLPHAAVPQLTDALGVLLEHQLVHLVGEARRVSLSAPVRAWAWARRQRRATGSAASVERPADALLWALLGAFCLRMSAIDDWLGTPRSALAATLLAQEEPNLWQALALGLSPEHPAVDVSLAVAERVFITLAKVAQFRDRSKELLPGLEGALRQALDHQSTPRLLGTAWHYIGQLRLRTDDLAGAAEAYAAALPLYRQIEDRLGEANTLRALGDLKRRKSDLAGAAEAYAAALPLYRQIEDRLGEANTLRALGDLKRRTDDLAGAAQAYAAALPLYRQIEARLGEANTLKSLGDLKLRTDDLAGAAEAYAAALPLYRQIEARLGEANTLRALGDLKLRTDDLAGAAQAYAAALPLYRQIEARLGEANTLKALGDLKLRTDDLGGAAEAYAAALPLYRQIEDRLGEANTLKALGDLKLRTDDLAGAAEAYAAALPLYRQIEDRLGEANTLNMLGQLALEQGLSQPAFAHCLQALRVQEAIGDDLGQGASHGYLARIAAQIGALDHATALTARAHAIFMRIQDRFGQMLCLRDLGQALLPAMPVPGVVCLLQAQALAEEIGDSTAAWVDQLVSTMAEGSEDAAGFTAAIDDLRVRGPRLLDDMFATAEAQVAEGGLDPYTLPAARNGEGEDPGEQGGNAPGPAPAAQE